MDYQKAEQIKQKNSHLIGKHYRGATIEEIVLIPTDPILGKDFIEMYMQTLDGNKAIIPFVGYDVDVVVIFDKKDIFLESTLFQTNIFNLSDELQILE